jgi:hypothetical protein
MYELRDVRDNEGELLEKYNFEIVEVRGTYPSKETFQVSAHTSEEKDVQVWKCDVCRDRCTWIMDVERGVEPDDELLQLRHE